MTVWTRRQCQAGSCRRIITTPKHNARNLLDDASHLLGLLPDLERRNNVQRAEEPNASPVTAISPHFHVRPASTLS